jgi:2-keto-4-pentenoate hydratase/2-oxohepta-3-ene-1,7-dioic acid hydratase in catechol pathway
MPETLPVRSALIQRSLKLERPPSAPFPLMYQGMASELLGACDDEPAVSAADQIDFEAEIGVFAGPLRVGTSRD